MLTKEQIDFITTSNDDDSQTGLPEPENTIQVIRSLNADSNNAYDIDYEQLTVSSEVYTARFNSIYEMADFIVSQIG